MSSVLEYCIIRNMISTSTLLKYIGIPFKDHGRGFDGCDCYGLVSLVYENELGIHLPMVGDLYADAYKKRQVNETVANVNKNVWCKTIEPDFNVLMPYDVLVFRIGGFDHHVGLYIGNMSMLHVIEGANAGIEKVTSIRWIKQFNRGLRYSG